MLYEETIYESLYKESLRKEFIKFSNIDDTVKELNIDDYEVFFSIYKLYPPKKVFSS